MVVKIENVKEVYYKREINYIPVFKLVQYECKISGSVFLFLVICRTVSSE